MQLLANSGIKSESWDIIQILENRIRKDELVLSGNLLKVGSFLNHQMDNGLFYEIDREFSRRFIGIPVSRIFAVEASCIGFACITAQYFNIPVVLQKTKSENISGKVYMTSVKSLSDAEGLRCRSITLTAHSNI